MKHVGKDSLVDTQIEAFWRQSPHELCGVWRETNAQRFNGC